MNIILTAQTEFGAVDLDLGKDTPNLLHNYIINEQNRWGVLAAVETLNSTLNLPVTQKNAQVFQNYENFASGGDPLDPIKATITYGGTYVLNGVLVLVDVDGFVSEFGNYLDDAVYSVVFKSMRGAWGAELQTLKLSDLGSYLDAENKEMNTSNIYAGFDAQYPFQNTGFFFQKYSNVWQTKTGSGGEKYPDLYEATGFIFAAALVDMIAKYLNIRFDSQFFDTTFFKSLIVPLPTTPKYEGRFSEDYLNVQALQTIAPTALNAPIIFDQINQQPAIGAIPYNNSTGIYTAPYKGFYQIEAVFNWVVPPSGTLVGASILYYNGAGQNVAPIPRAQAVAAPGTIFSATYNKVWELNAGDTMQFWGYPISTNQVASNSTLKIIGEAKNEYGKPNQLFLPKYLLRSWGARDFMLGLKQLFNLVFETSPNGRVVRVEPENPYTIRDRVSNSLISKQGFYSDPPANNPNILSKQDLDLKRGTKYSSQSEQAAQFLFTYLPDENDDYGRGAATEQTPIPRYGALYRKGAYLLNNNTEDRPNAFFCGTTHLFDAPATVVQPNFAAAVQIPLALPAPGVTDKFLFAPRILQFVARSTAKNADGIIKYTTANNVANLTQMVHSPAFMVNFNDQTGFDMSLSLSDTVVGGRNIKGLLATFYAETLSYSLSTKVVTTFFYIKSNVIANLSFKNKIIVFGKSCKILKIVNYNPLSESSSTQVTLLPDSTEQFNGLENTPISPIVS